MSDLYEDSPEAIEEFKDLMRDPAARQSFVELREKHARDDTRGRYEHILRAVAETPWAIRPGMLALIVDVLAFRAAGGRFTQEEIEQRIGAVRRGPVAQAPSGVAVIPLQGVLMPKAGAFSEMSGATSIERFRASFRDAMASREVSSIVLDIDSPGGMVDQTPEMAAEIRAARGTKRIVAVANTECCSGAYYLATQATEIVASRSARVGSIGVVTVHEDQSTQDEMVGIRMSIISAGRYKTDGNPFEPLSDDARAHLQTLVDNYYGMFVSDVAKGRRVKVDEVRAGFGEGRVVSAQEGLQLGMIDRIGSIDDVIREELTGAQPDVIAPSRDEGDDNLIDLPMAERAQASAAFGAVVDNSAWDKDKAMGECSTAAEYREICAGEHNAGQPDERQHWALPHHYLGKGPNADGVRNAKSRLPQTQDLKDRGKAERHLDAHMQEINPGASSAQAEDELVQLRAELNVLSV